MRSAVLIFGCLLCAFGANAGIRAISFEVYEGDTVNMIDENGLKQGHWIIFGRSKRGFAPDEKAEEGRYRDDRKNGLWMAYYPGEKLKSEISYENHRARGPYTIYWENGKIQEQGTWGRGRNVGSFKRWHRNGNLAQEFEFEGNTGQRSGLQKYYHENGELEVAVEMKAGRKNGTLKRYYSNGDLKEEMQYANGELDEASVKTYEPERPITYVEPAPVSDKVPVRDPEDKVNAAVQFVTDGYNKLVNRNKQVSQDGYFRNGKLYSGKWYRYDENGKLLRIEKYEKGYYQGDIPFLEEEQKLILDGDDR